MRFPDPFSERGVWLKAALHAHSTASDGLLRPEEVINYYARAGYRVVSITDHDKLTRLNSSNGCLVIPGIEVTAGKDGTEYHLVVLGVEEEPRRAKDPQDIIEWAKESSAVVIVAHPYWSAMGFKELTLLEGYDAIEIYNTGCDIEVGKGYSTVYWDYLLSHGIRVFGVAVDDAHRYTNPPTDALGGWVWIKVSEVETDAVLKALHQGIFYSSMGPEIKDFRLSSSTLFVKCSPVARIDIISLNGKGLSIDIDILHRLIKGWKANDKGAKSLIENITIKAADGMRILEVEMIGNVVISICEADGALHGLFIDGVNMFVDKYFRVEVTDFKGRRAWLNPIWLP